MGAALHEALHEASAADRVPALLAAYRRHALAHPGLYRLATTGPLPRTALPDGPEEWAGSPFYLATEDPHLAQALWSYAHGMVVLELDHRYPAGSDLDLTWQAGARAFTKSGAF
ncbi:TetR-like C-terminal domain-containing protein [Streptomyces roseifaciens]